MKNRGKVEFYTHVEATMPSHFVLRLKVIFWTSCARSHFWIFLLPVAIIAITVAICYFGIISILSTRGSYLGLVCLTSIYQYVYVFFLSAAPNLWKNLPLHIRLEDNFERFKSLLKRHIFRLAFDM